MLYIDLKFIMLLLDYLIENERRREGGKEVEGFVVFIGKGSFL